MSNNNKILSALIGGVLVGAIGTYASYGLWFSSNSSDNNPNSSQKEPLYWVAPMDANYRRDKPGKSPMGMDLVPVYEDGASGSDSGPGTIKISPEVVNNLGVRTAKAKYLPLHTQISTVGYVKYDEDQLVHIHPRVEGWVEKLYVKTSGDPVVKGQPLYDIYSPALVNAQEELLIALERKNQRLIKAAEDRLAALQLPKKAIAQLKSKRQVTQRITFYAPQNGVVDNLNIREGFFVKPGITLMSIGRLEQVWVEAEVFERQASEVEVGLPVTMTLAYLPGKEWEGKVDYVYPTLNEKNRTVKVRLRFENQEEQLKPNMFAQVLIHADDDSNSLLVPKEAIIRTGASERIVIALGEGRFKSINVKTGRFDGKFAEVISGVMEGDTVVTSAQFLLDSESSKSSDFKRMHRDAESADQAKSVWVAATINSMMVDHRMVNVTHDAIDEWEWPTMTMDFIVAETVDISLLENDMAIHVEIEDKGDSNYQIVNVHIPDPYSESKPSSNLDSVESVTVDGVINSLMIGHRMLNISREAIEQWGRAPATLDFLVNDTVDISSLKTGMKIRFTFHVVDGEFMITDVQPIIVKNQE